MGRANVLRGSQVQGGTVKTVGLSPSLINTRLKTLRVMFNCLFGDIIILDNPMKGVKNLPEPYEVFNIKSVREMRRILKRLTVSTSQDSETT